MIRRLISALVARSILAPALAAQSVPTPRDHFGFDMGEDRKLANWDQLTAYYEILAERSPRVVMESLGPTTIGQPFVMLTITSPENHARLEELHESQMKPSELRTISGAA